MNIAELAQRGKFLLAQIPRDALLLGIVLLASSASFGLGILVGREAGQGSAFTPLELPPLLEEQPAAAAAATGQVLGSKNGTKYYLPACASANRISEANKIWFASVEAARAAGYTPAANCKGL